MQLIILAVLVVVSQAARPKPDIVISSYPNETPEVAAAKKQHNLDWLRAKAAADAANYKNYGIPPKDIVVEVESSVDPAGNIQPRTIFVIPAFVAGLVVGAIVG